MRDNLVHISLSRSQTLFERRAKKKLKRSQLVRLDKQTTWFGRRMARPACRTRFVCPPSKAISRYSSSYGLILTTLSLALLKQMRFPTTFNTWSVVLLAAAMVTRTAATYHDPTELVPIMVSIHIDRFFGPGVFPPCGYYRIVGTSRRSSRASGGSGRVVCFLSSCTNCTCVPIIHVCYKCF